MSAKNQKIQAHGITHGAMKQLQEDQIAEIAPDTISGNVDSKYELPAIEKHLIHAEIEAPEFDQRSGAKLSTPRIQKYSAKEFDDHEKNNGFAGLKVTILHNPAKSDTQKPAANTKKVETKPAVDAGKPIEKMTLPELKDHYANLYKEQAPDGIQKKGLIDLINEKIDFLAEENEQESNTDTQEPENDLDI